MTTRNALIVGGEDHGRVWTVTTDAVKVCNLNTPSLTGEIVDSREWHIPLCRAWWTFPGRTDVQQFYYLPMGAFGRGRGPFWAVRSAALLAWSRGWSP